MALPEDPVTAPDAGGPLDVKPLDVKKTIALVGMMGAGKSSVGKRLAAALGLPFFDADTEIETAAGRTISEIFASMGEPAFRDGERRVIARLLAGPPHVLATGGGAFCQDDTRALLKAGAVTIWLKTEVAVLARRVGRKDTRPLLKDKDPLEAITALSAVRDPLYAQADIIIEAGDGPHAESVERVIAALKAAQTSAAQTAAPQTLAQTLAPESNAPQTLAPETSA